MFTIVGYWFKITPLNIKMKSSNVYDLDLKLCDEDDIRLLFAYGMGTDLAVRTKNKSDKCDPRSITN